MRRSVIIILLAVVLTIATQAAATTFRWSVPQANKTLHSFRFAKAGAVTTVRCAGKGRAVAARFAAFHCTVFGQIPVHGRQVAVNVDLQVTGLTRYHVTACQTASTPLTQKVCP